LLLDGERVDANAAGLRIDRAEIAWQVAPHD
jgi:hypothetical protein